MEISRRHFLHLATAAAPGTALAGLVGVGATLAPVLARAEGLRIKSAKTTPSVCPYCSVGCATLVHTIDDQIVNIEGDPAQPAQRRHALPEGRSHLPAAREPEPA